MEVPVSGEKKRGGRINVCKVLSTYFSDNFWLSSPHLITNIGASVQETRKKKQDGNRLIPLEGRGGWERKSSRKHEPHYRILLLWFQLLKWLQGPESSILLPNIVIKNSGEPCVMIYEEFTSSVGLCGVFITVKYHKTSVSSHVMT